jgi:pimeloyl-ACP methyl ester carboxylesterase
MADVDAGRLDAVLDEVCAVAAREDATFAERMSAVAMLLSHGLVDRAEPMLLELLPHPPAGQNLLLNLCRRIRRSAAMLPAYDAALGPSEVLLAAVPAAPKLLLIFPGIGGRFWGVNHFPLVKRTDVSLLFLRLRSERFYLAGIDGLGDTYAACLVALRRVVAELAEARGGLAPSVHCVGHSFGGHAALRFGLDLGAAAVLAFSAPTTLDFGAGPDRQSRLDAHPELRLLYERAPEMAADLHALYAAHPAPPRTVLCYGDAHAEDAETATRMRDLPGVRLEPIAGYGGHDTMMEAIRLWRFEMLMTELLST